MDAEGNLTHPDTEYEQAMEQNQRSAFENVGTQGGPRIRQDEEIKGAATTPQYSEQPPMNRKKTVWET